MPTPNSPGFDRKGEHMKMTNKQRAEVVELLRCAADLAAMGDIHSALGAAAKRLDRLMLPYLVDAFCGDAHWSNLVSNSGPVQNVSWSPDDKRLVCGPGYHLCLLEAAQRVEDKEWP